MGWWGAADTCIQCIRTSTVKPAVGNMLDRQTGLQATINSDHRQTPCAAGDLHAPVFFRRVCVGRRGEPLLNIPAVVAAAAFLKDQIGLSGRSVTISTVGVPNALATLGQHQLTATLAVSIHAPNQELREALIPSARVYPLQV